MRVHELVLKVADDELRVGFHPRMTVLCGLGADERQELAESIVAVAGGAGLKTRALITDMNQILGSDVGNALEVLETVRYLTGEHREPRLHEVTLALCAEMLVLGGLATDATAFHPQAEEDIEAVAWVPWAAAAGRLGYESLRRFLASLAPDGLRGDGEPPGPPSPGN